MANKKISELDTLVGNVAATDIVEVQKNGETSSKKATLTQLTAVEVAARVAQDDVIEAGVGLNTNGTYPSLPNSWYLRAADFVTGIIDRSGAVANITESVMGALRVLDYKIYQALSSLAIWTRNSVAGTLTPTTATDTLIVQSAKLGVDTNNSIDIPSTGFITLKGTARMKTLMWHHISGLDSSAARVSTWIGGLKVLTFDDSSIESFYFSIPLPYGYDEGTDIIPILHWIPMASAGTPTRVRWGLEYIWQENGVTGAATSTIYSTTIDPNENLIGYRQYETRFDAISGTGHTRNSILSCRLFRDATNVADDFTGDAGALTIHFDVINNNLGEVIS